MATTQSSPESLYSQACNFTSFLQKGVDPRTGQYTCSIQLYEAPAQTRNCPVFKLGLGFSPMSSGRSEFGRGWSLNLPSVDPTANTVQTSTGEVYHMANNRQELKDLKLQSFQFEWDWETRQGTFRYKSGQVEVFSGKINDRIFNRAELQKLYAPNGHALDFLWVPTDNDRRLDRIMDGAQCLVQFEYERWITRIITAPDTPEARTYSMLITEGLDRLDLPGADELSWKFGYNFHGPLWCIDRLESPSGLKEQIDYHEQSGAHRLPSGPKQPYPIIPNVSRHIIWPGQGQPPITTLYRYSDRNFLGFGSSFQWTDEGDNLYLMSQPYNYETTMTVGDGDTPKTTTVYTYNKYHLEASSVQRQGRKTVARETSYYANQNQNFSDQPAYYLLPEKTQTTYTDGDSDQPPRTETTSYKYDEAGNPLEEIQPDGQVTTRTYFGSQAEENCPGDPWGFIRYLKEEVVTPAPSKHQVPIFRRAFIYESQGTVAGAPKGYFVAVQQERSFAGINELTRTDYQYISDITSPDLGRPSLQVDKIVNGHPISHAFTYTRSPSSADEVTHSIESTTFDGQMIRHQSITSLLTGLEKSHTNRSGVTCKFEYDSLGRLTAVIACPESDYVSTRSQAYTRVEDDVGYCLTLTDGYGVKTKYFTDGLERVIRAEKQDTSDPNTYRVVQERNYNELGQCVEAVEIDWLKKPTGPSPVEQRTVTQLEYDDWGQIYRQIRSDGEAKGVATITDMDQTTLKKTEGIEGEGQVVTLMDVRGAVLQKTLLTKDGKEESTVKYEYDGLGRQVSETDQLGRKTELELDDFDRTIKTTWPSGRIIRTEYSAQSASVLPVAFKLGSHELGSQSFDGLDRIKSTTVASRTSTNQFEENAHTEPQQIAFPDGEQIAMSYDPELNYAVTKVSEKSQDQVFKLDKRTGAPTRLENNHLAQTLEYTRIGLVAREQWQLQENTKESWSAEYTYSFAGRLESYTDVHGQKQETQYDSLGQPQKLTQGPLNVEYTYDQAQRLSLSDITTTSDDRGLTTKRAYDDFGRVRERTVSRGDVVLQTMTVTYGPIGLITQRSVKTGSGTNLRSETFAYDEHNRLVEYSCDGSDSPVDEHGHPLQAQKFEFDDFDNLATVTTTFQDGNQNISSSRFSADDPTQLAEIRNTHSDFTEMVTLEYDQNGALTRDEKGQELRYDSCNRISKVLDAKGDVLCEYRYDATGKLVGQIVPNQADTHLFYRADTLVAIKTGDRQTSLVAGGPGGYWGQLVQDQAGDITAQTWATDGHGSNLVWVEGDQVHQTQYTPYGFSPLSESDSSTPSIAFNGQWRDPITGWYHLGNGYRVYNPVLMRFHTPDPWSPFTSGEINPYAYCLGDPINRVDSNGHFSLFGMNFGWKDLALLIVGAAASVAMGVLTGGASLAIQIGVSVAVGAAVEFTTSVVYDVAAGDKIDWKQLGIDTAFSLGASVFGAGKQAAKALAKPAQKVAQTVAKKTTSKMVKGLAKDFGKELVSSAAMGGLSEAAMSTIKEILAGEGHASNAGPGQSVSLSSSSQNHIEGDTNQMGHGNMSSFVSRDSIRPALKESQLSLGLYAGQGASTLYHNAGQSVANLLNRDLRASYGQLGDKPVHGLGAQHRIRSEYDSIRETVRRSHVAADWGSVPNLGGA